MKRLLHSKKVLLPLVFFCGLLVMGGMWYVISNSSPLTVNNENTSDAILDVSSSTGDSYLRVTSDGKVGIDNQIPQTALDVNGMIRVYTTTTSPTRCTIDIEGAIDYDAYYKHFFGCNGTAWHQLDN
jgi:hypothetical protein